MTFWSGFSTSRNDIGNRVKVEDMFASSDRKREGKREGGSERERGRERERDRERETERERKRERNTETEKEKYSWALQQVKTT